MQSLNPRVPRAALALALFVAPAAGAMLLAPPSLNTQFDLRDAVIVEATVVSESSEIVTAPDGDELIATYFALEAVDAGQGSTLPSADRLILPGGTVGDVRVDWSDVPPVAVGSHYVLVGNVNGDGVLRLASFGNSVFLRLKDADGVDVVADATGRTLAEVPCDSGPVPANPHATEWDVVSNPEGVSAPAMAWAEFVEMTRDCRAQWSLE